ncbi:MAG: hypothetical protein JWM36_4059 [Hyphomicrobiales bacterium]|nr:hypothetical protein [Hyphomicrobiales bacterium]
MAGVRQYFAVVATFAVFGFCPAAAFAQSSQDAVKPSRAAYSGKASDKQVADFKANKSSILRSSPIGGAQMSAQAKGLTLADPSVVDDIIAAAKEGNRPQANAIGAGLGQAVKALEATDKELAQSIARKIASANNGDLFAGYNAGTGDIRTFATGTGTGTGAGTGGTGGTGTGGVGGIVGGGLVSSAGSPPTSAVGSTSLLTGSQLTTTSFAGASVSCTQSVSPTTRC